MAKTHDPRPDLTGEHRIGDLGQLLFVILFAVVWLGDTIFLKFSAFLNDDIPLWIRLPPGVLLALSAWYLAATSHGIVFREKRDLPEVITKKVYSRMRHPMYFAEVLLYVALMLFSISIAAAFVACGAILFLFYISRHEERLLLTRYGEEYRSYMRQVPMWVPRPWRKFHVGIDREIL